MIEFARSMWMPQAASTHAGQVDALIGWVHLLMLVLFVGWGIFFFYILVRFRKRRNPKANYEGTHSHLSRYVEGAVAVIEIALLFGLSVPVWARQIANPVPAEEAMTIRVVGQQFAWNIHYPGADGVFGATSVDLVDAEANPVGVDRDDVMAKDDVVTVNQLHIPVDTPIRIELSAFDVVHSFFLPEMRVKQDAIPGMTIPLQLHRHRNRRVGDRLRPTVRPRPLPDARLLHRARPGRLRRLDGRTRRRGGGRLPAQGLLRLTANTANGTPIADLTARTALPNVTFERQCWSPGTATSFQPSLPPSPRE